MYIYILIYLFRSNLILCLCLHLYVGLLFTRTFAFIFKSRLFNILYCFFTFTSIFICIFASKWFMFNSIYLDDYLYVHSYLYSFIYLYSHLHLHIYLYIYIHILRAFIASLCVRPKKLLAHGNQKSYFKNISGIQKTTSKTKESRKL